MAMQGLVAGRSMSVRSVLGSILWAKQRTALHTLASVRRESKLKVAFVSISAVLFWIGIFQLSRLGFRFLEELTSTTVGTGGLSLSDLIMARMLSVFALVLFAMLVFSNVLVSFSTLYRSREVSFLIISPISTSTFFLGRFYECVTFTSWTSAFLGSPVLLAYGLETSASPVFYLALVTFYLPFVVIPAAIGSIVTITAVRFLAHRRRPIWFGMVGLALTGVFVLFRAQLGLAEVATTPSFQSLVTVLTKVQSPFLPSTWLSQGILDATTGAIGDSLFKLLLLLSNALALVWVATLVAERWFYTGWSSLTGGLGGSLSRRFDVSRVVDRLLRPLPEPTRSLVSKDIKLFWRDPAQWTQFVLFFGIMALYVANLRGARSFAGQESWRALGTLLNLGASMLILASLTTRFVFPLVSLEGRRFWILGLSPVTLRHIVWQKFWLSVATTSFFTVGLAVLSAIQLDLDRITFVLSVAGMIATTVALSGLAVGLGSLYPNFQEDNPARIVSGMGGTLNFLLSMLYIALVAAGQAVVLFWSGVERVLGGGSYAWVVAAAVGWIALVTAITCMLPLHLGLRNLERAEF